MSGLSETERMDMDDMKLLPTSVFQYILTKGLGPQVQKLKEKIDDTKDERNEKRCW